MTTGSTITGAAATGSMTTGSTITGASTATCSATASIAASGSTSTNSSTASIAASTAMTSSSSAATALSSISLMSLSLSPKTSCVISARSTGICLAQIASTISLSASITRSNILSCSTEGDTGRSICACNQPSNAAAKSTTVMKPKLRQIPANV